MVVDLNTSLFFKIFSLSGKSGFLDQLMIFGAEILVFVTLMATLLLVLRGGSREKKAVILIVIGIIVAEILVRLTKTFYAEPRPFTTYDIIPLITRPQDATFPSGHTAIMTVVAVSYAFYKSRFAPFFFVLMLWVGFARIFVGVHHPLDILGGIIFGLVSTILAREIKTRLKKLLFKI